MAASLDSFDKTGRVIPDQERISRLPLTMAWWSLCSAMFYIFIAASLATMYGTKNAVIGILLTILVFSPISVILARRSIRDGLSIELLSIKLFGAKGGGFATLLVAVTAAYYAVFEGSILSVGINKVFPAITYFYSCLIVVTVTSLMTLRPVRELILKLNILLMLVYFTGIVILIDLAGSRFGWSSDWLSLLPSQPQPTGWWHCFAAYLGVASLLMVVPDFARSGKKDDVPFHVRFNFGYLFYCVTFLGSGLVGIFLVGTVRLAQISETAVLDATLAVLGGGVGLLFVWVTQTRINLANFSISAMNVEAFAEQIFGVVCPKWVGNLVCAIAIFGLMLFNGVFKYLIVALQYQAIFICSWIGVVLAAGARPETDGAGSRDWRADGLIPWLGSAACAALLCYRGGDAGAIAPAVSFIMATITAKLIAMRMESRLRAES